MWAWVCSEYPVPAECYTVGAGVGALVGSSGRRGVSVWGGLVWGPPVWEGSLCAWFPYRSVCASVCAQFLCTWGSQVLQSVGVCGEGGSLC